MTYPGPRGTQILEDAEEFYVTSTNNSRAIIDRGDGPYLYDVDGYKYIDLHCGAGVTNLGHNHQPSIQAICERVQKTGIIHTEHHNAFNPTAIELSKFLALNSPVKKPAKVFLSNSGAEANEAARKACEAYRYHRGEQQTKSRAIYFENGFAGRTHGVLAATTSNPTVQRDPYWTHCDQENSIYLPYPTKEHSALLKQKLSELDLSTIDRLLIELPCQGEAGIIPADEETLKNLYEVTHNAGILWIVDSIQCGIGRVGTLFGCDFYPWLEPDILTLAKALGGGLPIGATILRADLDWKKGEHSNTFGGNPVISQLALTVLSCVQELIRSGAIKKIEQAMRKRLYILRNHPMVQDTRGLGAMWAVELPDAKLRDRLIDVGEEMAQTENYGIKLLSAGKKSVRLMPSLTISPKDLTIALDLFLVALNRLLDDRKSVALFQQFFWDKQHKDRGIQGHEGNDLKFTPNSLAVELQNILPPSSNILEIGCANGRDARFFAMHGHTVVGIDISKVALTQMMNLAKQQGCDTHITPIHHDISQGLPTLRALSFDCFYARSSLHIDNEQMLSLAKMLNFLLKDFGFIAIEGKGEDDLSIKQSEVLADNLVVDWTEGGHLRRIWTNEFCASLAQLCSLEIVTLKEIKDELFEKYFLRFIAKKIN